MRVPRQDSGNSGWEGGRNVTTAPHTVSGIPGTLTELLELIATLGPDEHRVVLAVARRLAGGASTYGRLNVQGDPRNWHQEATEELLDGCVYLACASMRRETTP
jgi:hypothetical protein